jgi:L-cysteine desulfidase
MQNQFALESIKIELQKKDIKIQEIQNENSILLSRNEVLEEEKNILIVEVEKLNAILFEIEAKKNTRDGLFLQIGEYID